MSPLNMHDANQTLQRERCAVFVSAMSRAYLYHRFIPSRSGLLTISKRQNYRFLSRTKGSIIYSSNQTLFIFHEVETFLNLHLVYATVLAPPAESLALVVEEDPEQTPQRYQRTIGHDWLDKTGECTLVCICEKI